jgi:hypothetical protein
MIAHVFKDGEPTNDSHFAPAASFPISNPEFYRGIKRQFPRLKAGDDFITACFGKTNRTFGTEALDEPLGG